MSKNLQYKPKIVSLFSGCGGLDPIYVDYPYKIKQFYIDALRLVKK